jgi:glucose-1-phosphate thymidylyltransferase
VVTGGEHFSAIGGLLGSGDEDDLSQLGLSGRINISYGVQKKPAGIAHALWLAKEFAGKDPVAVVLGDNIFEDYDVLKGSVSSFDKGAHIFIKEVPKHLLYERNGTEMRAKYGIAEIQDLKVLSIEEKPLKPKSNFSVTGAYIYDSSVFDIVSTLKPSKRGELEITDVNNAFIERGAMSFTIIKGEWTDAGSIETLRRAGSLVAEWKPSKERV